MTAVRELPSSWKVDVWKDASEVCYPGFKQDPGRPPHFSSADLVTEYRTLSRAARFMTLTSLQRLY